jgi:hypothetical protein
LRRSFNICETVSLSLRRYSIEGGEATDRSETGQNGEYNGL